MSLTNWPRRLIQAVVPFISIFGFHVVIACLLQFQHNVVGAATAVDHATNEASLKRVPFRALLKNISHPKVPHTRLIDELKHDLSRTLSENFGPGFRSVDFPCDEEDHRSLFWARKNNMDDTPTTRKQSVMQTLLYLRELFDRYNIGPWCVKFCCFVTTWCGNLDCSFWTSGGSAVERYSAQCAMEPSFPGTRFVPVLIARVFCCSWCHFCLLCSALLSLLHSCW